MRIVAIGANEFPLSERHMGGAHELRFALEMALTANFRLRALVKKRRVVVDLGKLITVGGFFHQRVTADAGHAAARVRTRLPIGLNSPLMAGETRRVLYLG